MKKTIAIAGSILLGFQSFSQQNTISEEARISALSLSAGLNSLLMYQISGGYEATFKDNIIVVARLNLAKEINLLGTSEDYDNSGDLIVGLQFTNRYSRLVLSSGVKLGKQKQSMYAPVALFKWENTSTESFYVGLPLELKFQFSSDNTGFGIKLFGNINHAHSYGGAAFVFDIGKLR